jgi:hypothetical protein
MGVASRENPAPANEDTCAPPRGILAANYRGWGADFIRRRFTDHDMHCEFAMIPKTLGVTSAMEAG